MITKSELAKLHSRINELTQANETFIKKARKYKLLADMCEGREKQYKRDDNATRRIYNDIIDDMMTRQILMVSVGWDERVQRKQAKLRNEDEC